MIKKILFLISSPFNQRDYKRFGIDTLVQNGFEVHVWDFTPFIHPLVYKTVLPPDPIDYKNLVQFKNKREALNALNEQRENSFIIDALPKNFNTYSIFRAISKNKIPFALFLILARPVECIGFNNKSMIKRVARITPKKLFNFVSNNFMKIPPHLLKLRYADYFFVGGNKGLLSAGWPLLSSKTKIVWIHCLDYDLFLNREKDEKKGNETMVFLDSYLPFHPDSISAKVSPIMNAEEYFPVLRKFFDYLEEKSGLEMIIAAHPRSHYEKYPDLYGERKVVRDKTIELVRNSKLVVLHGSLAMNFAILYKKPMVFFTTDEIENSPYGKRCWQIASFFNKTPINISREVNIDLENEFIVDDEKYAQYKNDFIKEKGSEELPFWQVASNKIKLLSS